MAKGNLTAKALLLLLLPLPLLLLHPDRISIASNAGGCCLDAQGPVMSSHCCSTAPAFAAAFKPLRCSMSALPADTWPNAAAALCGWRCCHFSMLCHDNSMLCRDNSMFCRDNSMLRDNSYPSSWLARPAAPAPAAAVDAAAVDTETGCGGASPVLQQLLLVWRQDSSPAAAACTSCYCCPSAWYAVISLRELPADMWPLLLLPLAEMAASAAATCASSAMQRSL